MTLKLRQIVADTLNLDLNEVSGGASMKTLHQWDSMGHLNIVMSVEQEFGVRLPPDQVLEVTGIAEIERALRSLRATNSD